MASMRGSVAAPGDRPRARGRPGRVRARQGASRTVFVSPVAWETAICQPREVLT